MRGRTRVSYWIVSMVNRNVRCSGPEPGSHSGARASHHSLFTAWIAVMAV